MLEVVKSVEDFVSGFLPEAWDNCGFQIDLKQEEISKVLLCVSVTSDVVEFAVSHNVDLIVSHHPLFFENVKKIADEKVIRLIKKGISVFSLHTNFDKAQTSKSLAKVLGFENTQNFNDFVVFAQVENFDFDIFAQKVKKNLNLEFLKVCNFKAGKKFEKIAFCSGSGSGFIKEKGFDFDLYITSDVKYHDYIDYENITIMDVGHLQSEKPSLDVLQGIISCCDVEVVQVQESSRQMIL